jgi:hypothetical protein
MHVVMHVAMVSHVMVVVAPMTPVVVVAHRSGRRARRVRNGLHGDLRGRRSPHQRGNRDGRDCDGWKLHGIFPYEVNSVSPDS